MEAVSSGFLLPFVGFDYLNKYEIEHCRDKLSLQNIELFEYHKKTRECKFHGVIMQLRLCDIHSIFGGSIWQQFSELYLVEMAQDDDGCESHWILVSA